MLCLLLLIDRNGFGCRVIVVNPVFCDRLGDHPLKA